MSNLAARPKAANPRDAPCTLVIVWFDCGASVFEWSTPHVDRCWECAEILDLEAGP